MHPQVIIRDRPLIVPRWDEETYERIIVPPRYRRAPQHAAIAHVGSDIKGGTADTVTTDAIDLTASGGATLLITATAWFNLTTVNVTPVDSQTNTWTPLTKIINGIWSLQLFYVNSNTPSVSASQTVTIAGTSTFACAALYGFKDTAAVPFDQESGSTTATPGTLTPSENGCVVFTAYENAGDGGAFSINGGFETPLTEAFSGGNHGSLATSYLIQTTAAAANPTWGPGGGNSTSVMAVFKPGGGGASIVGNYYNRLVSGRDGGMF